MAGSNWEKTIMEKDRQELEQLTDMPSREEERLRTEKEQAEEPGLQDECQNLIHELQIHQSEQAIENEDLKRRCPSWLKWGFTPPSSISPP
jgi:hypothetical protein